MNNSNVKSDVAAEAGNLDQLHAGLEGVTAKATTISITGYEQDGYCEHCGRPLKHCIRLDDGRIVGATCFDKILTKPRRYQGKPYRIGSENVVRYAKLAELGRLQQADLTARDLTFEAAA